MDQTHQNQNAAPKDREIQPAIQQPPQEQQLKDKRPQQEEPLRDQSQPREELSPQHDQKSLHKSPKKMAMNTQRQESPSHQPRQEELSQHNVQQQPLRGQLQLNHQLIFLQSSADQTHQNQNVALKDREIQLVIQQPLQEQQLKDQWQQHQELWPLRDQRQPREEQLRL